MGLTRLYGLMKTEADRRQFFTLYGNGEGIVCSERFEIIDLGPDDDEEDPSASDFRKAEAVGFEEAMASVFEVIEVNGVINDALLIAFVVPDREASYEGIVGGHGGSGRCGEGIFRMLAVAV